MVYEILLYLHEIGFRSVLDGQSGEKSPSQGEHSASQGGAAPQPWEAPRGTCKITWTKITSNFLTQKTKENVFNHDSKLYIKNIPAVLKFWKLIWELYECFRRGFPFGKYKLPVTLAELEVDVHIVIQAANISDIRPLTCTRPILRMPPPSLPYTPPHQTLPPSGLESFDIGENLLENPLHE